jgi:UDP-N-acetylmuramoylalanine--D-glutamate ligase
LPTKNSASLNSLGKIKFMKIGIVGWGVEGRSAYNYFGPDNDYLIASEEPVTNPLPNSNRIKLQQLDKQRRPGLTGNVSDLSYLDGLQDCDKIIYTTPAAKNLEKKFGTDKAFWSKATTTQHIFFEAVKTKNIIGVTGTKGKGTTSTLVFELLKSAGKTAFLGGNIGQSPLDFIKDVEQGDWVVLELSNFQLYNLTYSPHVAVCLMIVPEHLEWHPDMTDYVAAKANIFRHQKPNDVAVYFSANKYSKEIANLSQGKKVPYFAAPGARLREDGMIVIGENEQEIISKTEVKLLGEHNLQNICAACTAVYEALGSLDKAKTVLSNFSGLEHRLELVREFEGVKYYDDSFATTPETTIVAMKAIKAPKVMILGGHDKGANYEALADEVLQQNPKHTITIGLVGPRIAARLKANGFNSITENPPDMEAIVAAARQHAGAGDAVLLSCGTSSFGMFKDYKDRGSQFKKAVLELA